MSESLRQTLESGSMPEPNSGCLLWCGAADQNGYGMMRWGKRNARAHRFSWEERHGPIPTGKVVCHKCDVPSCINVDHLFLGTQADNMADRNRKSRQARGEKCAQAKLTPEIVRAIRLDKRAGKTIAAEHGVHWMQIYRIRSGKTWSHV